MRLETFAIHAINTKFADQVWLLLKCCKAHSLILQCIVLESNGCCLGSQAAAQKTCGMLSLQHAQSSAFSPGQPPSPSLCWRDERGVRIEEGTPSLTCPTFQDFPSRWGSPGCSGNYGRTGHSTMLPHPHSPALLSYQTIAMPTTPELNVQLAQSS